MECAAQSPLAYSWRCLRCPGILARARRTLHQPGCQTTSQALQPSESEAGELRDHVIIAGFGRVGQIIGQLLSERLIPFVALDLSSDRVQVSPASHSRLIGVATLVLPCTLPLLITLSRTYCCQPARELLPALVRP